MSSGATTEGVTCVVCGRSFRRPDLKRHKCTEERRKPVEEQGESVQCAVCYLEVVPQCWRPQCSQEG